MNYSTISNFGPNVSSPIDNPLSYCTTAGVNNSFLHGSSADELAHNSRPCQAFMSEYCNQNWDNYCEFASQSGNTSKPNNLLSCVNPGPNNVPNVTDGEALIRNTASKRYLVAMLGGEQKWEPFDATVANSPLISYWQPANHFQPLWKTMTPIYAVDPETIENDVVMHKILNKPHIAFDILVNIYNTMKRNGSLQKLLGTRLGSLYQTHNYFVAKGGL